MLPVGLQPAACGPFALGRPRLSQLPGGVLGRPGASAMGAAKMTEQPSHEAQGEQQRSATEVDGISIRPASSRRVQQLPSVGLLVLVALVAIALIVKSIGASGGARGGSPSSGYASAPSYSRRAPLPAPSQTLSAQTPSPTQKASSGRGEHGATPRPRSSFARSGSVGVADLSSASGPGAPVTVEAVARSGAQALARTRGGGAGEEFGFER